MQADNERAEDKLDGRVCENGRGRQRKENVRLACYATLPDKESRPVPHAAPSSFGATPRATLTCPYTLKTSLSLPTAVPLPLPSSFTPTSQIYPPLTGPHEVPRDF